MWVFVKVDFGGCGKELVCVLFGYIAEVHWVDDLMRRGFSHLAQCAVVPVAADVRQ